MVATYHVGWVGRVCGALQCAYYSRPWPPLWVCVFHADKGGRHSPGRTERCGALPWLIGGTQ